MRASSGRHAEVAHLEAQHLARREEGIEVHLLRHQADLPPRRHRVAHDVVAEHAAVPPVGRARPQTIEIQVVLPAPLGPSSAKISPGSIGRLTPRSASTLG